MRRCDTSEKRGFSGQTQQRSGIGFSLDAGMLSVVDGVEDAISSCIS